MNAPASESVLQLASALAGLLDREAPPPRVDSARFVTVALAAVMTGLTEKAIRRKIDDGVWIEGREYRRAPDGRIFIDMRGFEAWVAKETA